MIGAFPQILSSDTAKDFTTLLKMIYISPRVHCSAHMPLGPGGIGLPFRFRSWLYIIPVPIPVPFPVPVCIPVRIPVRAVPVPVPFPVPVPIPVLFHVRVPGVGEPGDGWRLQGSRSTAIKITRFNGLVSVHVTMGGDAPCIT